MKIKLILLVSIFTLLFVVLNATASVPILYHNIDDINNVQIKFMLVDNSNRVVPDVNINSGNTTLFDNNLQLPINQYITSMPPAEDASLSICFDLSISNRTNNSDDFDFAKDALVKYISYLSDTTNMALLSMANIACIEIDWTNNRSQIATAVNNFKTDNFIQSMFVSLYNGMASEYISGLSLLSDRLSANRTLLLVTQGVINNDETELLISKAKQNNVRINILYISENVPRNMQRLADQTGGFCVSKTMLQNDFLPMLASLAKVSEGHSPYMVNATGKLNCSGEHDIELTVTTFGNSNFYEKIDSKQFTTITSDPAGLEFPSVKPGTASTKTVTLVAENAGVNITKITTSNTLFKITSVSKQPPLYLEQNEELTIDISFTPVDSTIAFGMLQVVSDACTYDTLYLTGGYPNVAPVVPTINIIQPKCDDVLIVGDTVEIVWNGVLAKDIVSLNAQSSTNKLDTFALNVLGLSHKYYISPDLDADSLRFIVNQMWPNNVGKTLTFKHQFPVKFAFFNTFEDKIITANNDKIVSVWNANTGALLHQFRQFNKEVRWAKFIKHPQLSGMECIAIACADSCAYMFNADDYSLIWRHKANTENIYSIEASPDGKYVAIAVGDAISKGNFDVLDVLTGELKQRTFIPVENCRYVVFHPTKKYEIMAISNWSGVLYFYNMTENNDKIDITYYDNIDAKNGIISINANYADYNHDGSKILLHNPQTESLDIIDRASKKTLFSIQHSTKEYQKTPRFASFFYSKNGTSEQDYVVTSGGDNLLKRWNVSDGSPSPQPNVFAEHKQGVNSGVFNVDGWRLLSASDDSTAKIWNLNQKVLQADTSCFLPVVVAKCEVVDTARFNDTYTSKISIKALKQYFKNICDFGYNIRSIRIVGDNSADFVLADEFDYPMKINALEALDFNIIFRPQTAGLKSANLQIIIPNDTVYIALIGTGINIGLQPLCELINFGNITINDYKDTLVALAINSSNDDIILSDIALSGPQQNNFNIKILNTNNTLKPQDTLLASVRFYSTTVGRKFATLNMRNNYNNMIVKWNLMGTVIDLMQDTIELSIKDFAAKTGELINCPIYVNVKTKNQTLNINEIKFTIKFNSTLLYPQTFTENVTILSRKYNDNDAMVDISVAYKPGQEQIDGLQFLALLGNDTTTLITTIDCHINTDSRAKIISSNALFTLSDYCTAGGNRLFDQAGMFNLKQNVPNPVTNATTIDYDILESGQAMLDIFNIAGQHVKNIFNEYKAKGSYSIEIETLNWLPGTYFYTLQNGIYKQTQIMTITK